MIWSSESEERLVPRLLRAVWSRDESERDAALAPVGALALAPSGEDSIDVEGPIRGRLRRALLAID